MELLKLEDSRKRYQLLLGNKGDFMYDIDVALKLFEGKMSTDSFSLGQLQSKTWAVEIMQDLFAVKKLDYGIVFILCGWYATLAALMFYARIPILKIRSFDVDPECEKIADFINKTNCDNGWRFKAITEDIYNIDFNKHSWQCWSNKNSRMSYPITDSPNTIINTACEHTDKTWYDKVPDGKLMVLQSNDSFTEFGHVNAVTDLEEFESMYPMKEIYYKGKLNLDNLTRFMLIGVK